jgi:hypothetical protein
MKGIGINYQNSNNSINYFKNDIEDQKINADNENSKTKKHNKSNNYI